MSDAIKVEVQETLGSQITEPQKPEVKPQVKEEPKYVRIEDLEKVSQAINNTRDYNNRQLNEIRAELQKLAPKPISTGDPDLDELVTTDWKAAVEKITEKVIERQQERQAQETEMQRTARILEESKSKIMAKHPELSDPENPKTKEFLKVLEENPDFKTNPRGPILAAYEMENRLKAHDTIDSGERMPQKDVRAKATSVPAGTSASKKAGYTLTKQDMDFCRLNNINPENYRRLKGMKETVA